MRVAMIVLVSACWTAGPPPVIVPPPEPPRETPPPPDPNVSLLDVTPEKHTWYCFDEHCRSSDEDCMDERQQVARRQHPPPPGMCQRATVVYCWGKLAGSCTPDFATCETRALAHQATCREEHEQTTWRFSRKRPYISGAREQ